jgi:type I restriction and modification enzyme subunit R-like protein
MGTSHLVMGELSDYLTEDKLPDTHDERLIQKISRFLVEGKGFSKEDILSRQKMTVTVDDKKGTVTVHFIIRVNNISFAVVLYGPGSIVTRQRPTIAVARLLEKESIIPYCVITNGNEANLIDTQTGKVIGKEMNSLFSKNKAIELLKNFSPAVLKDDRREKEKRILYTMEILTENECKEFVCKLC